MVTRTSQIFLPAPSVKITTFNGYNTNKRVYNGLVGEEFKYSHRNWVRTFKFRSLVKNRKVRTTTATLPMNPYTHSTRITGPNPYDNFIKFRPDSWYPNNWTLMEQFPLVTNQTTLNMSDARFSTLFNNAVAKLPKRMNGGSFNLPLFLHEARKTTAMVTNAATSLAKLFRGVKTHRQAHNMWLEYRYGWRLLIKDLYDAMVVVHSIRSKSIKQRVSVTATLDASTGTYYDSLIGDPGVGISVRHNVTDKEHLECKITLLYKEDNPTLGTLSQLGITNPLALAYEVIPYSFVFDWFVNVSGYLSTLDYHLGKTFQAGCVSYVYNVEREIRWNKYIYDTSRYPRFQLISKYNNVVPQKIRSYKRVSLSTFPTQSLPTINPNLNLSRLTDAVSLLLQKKQHWR